MGVAGRVRLRVGVFTPPEADERRRPSASISARSSAEAVAPGGDAPPLEAVEEGEAAVEEAAPPSEQGWGEGWGEGEGWG